MEGLELISFEIISAVGAARSSYIEAIRAAKNKEFERARTLVEEGNEFFQNGHHAHAKLIQQEAAGEPITVNILLVHAEDQLMSAETFKILSEEFIDLYSRI